MVHVKRSYDDIECLRSLYSLLRSYVEAELAALQDVDIVNETAQKKIHFCSFNFSSVITPIDTSTESCNIIEDCIWKLQAVLEEIKQLLSKDDKDDTINLVKHVIKTFGDLENENGGKSFAECSKVRKQYTDVKKI